MSPGAILTLFFKISRDSDSTTDLGSLLQGWSALSVNKCFLIPNLNFPKWNFRPFPPVLKEDVLQLWGNVTGVVVNCLLVVGAFTQSQIPERDMILSKWKMQDKGKVLRSGADLWCSHVQGPLKRYRKRSFAMEYTSKHPKSELTGAAL